MVLSTMYITILIQLTGTSSTGIYLTLIGLILFLLVSASKILLIRFIRLFMIASIKMYLVHLQKVLAGIINGIIHFLSGSSKPRNVKLGGFIRHSIVNHTSLNINYSVPNVVKLNLMLLVSLKNL